MAASEDSLSEWPTLTKGAPTTPEGGQLPRITGSGVPPVRMPPLVASLLRTVTDRRWWSGSTALTIASESITPGG